MPQITLLGSWSLGPCARTGQAVSDEHFSTELVHRAVDRGVPESRERFEQLIMKPPHSRLEKALACCFALCKFYVTSHACVDGAL